MAISESTQITTRFIPKLVQEAKSANFKYKNRLWN